MADLSSTVNSVVGGIVSLIKGLIVFFVFANILYPTGIGSYRTGKFLYGWRPGRPTRTVNICFFPVG